jgi:hypothetical protein
MPSAEDGRREATMRSGDRTLFVWIEQLDLYGRHDGRYRVLIDKLGMTIPPQQNRKLIEPRHNALQLYAVDKENRDRRFVFADVVQEHILNIL